MIGPGPVDYTVNDTADSGSREAKDDATLPACSLYRRRSAHVWVSSTYFAEGFPYSVVNNLAEIMFKELGASLQVIGLTALLHLPWNLKFLWGPLVDHYETKRRWLIATEVLLSTGLVGLAWFAGGAAGWQMSQTLGAVAAAFAVLAVLSATHDIAIDGFYLEGLDEQRQSKFVGYRAMAYKVASLLVRGPLIMVVGWVGWTWGLLGAALVMVLLTVLHAVVLPRVEVRRRGLGELVGGLLRWPVLVVGALVAVGITVIGQASGDGSVAGALVRAWEYVRSGPIPLTGWMTLLLLVMLAAAWLFARGLRGRTEKVTNFYASAFVDFLARPNVGLILAFVVLFRTGESFLQKMKWPFLRDAMGMQLDTYGFANGTLGVLASFAGTLVGGWLIARQGLGRWIWPFVLAQNVLNLLYALIAYLSASVTIGTLELTLLITAEHFGEGLGTAVFMVYLMRCCDPAHKAAHMAILTALMSVSFTVAGVASGFLAAWMGFAAYFAFTFVASIPGMLLIPWIPNKR